MSLWLFPILCCVCISPLSIRYAWIKYCSFEFWFFWYPFCILRLLPLPFDDHLVCRALLMYSFFLNQTKYVYLRIRNLCELKMDVTWDCNWSNMEWAFFFHFLGFIVKNQWLHEQYLVSTGRWLFRSFRKKISLKYMNYMYY